MNMRPWPCRLGLAGGIDKDGSRSAELLAAGFDSIEFGTVTPCAENSNPGVAALATRLSVHMPRGSRTTRIGIGIGMGSHAQVAALPEEWLSGFHGAWAAADYLCFNLSARRYQTLLCDEHVSLLLQTFEVLAAARARKAAESHRHVGLTLKLALGTSGSLPLCVAEAAADAGFDAVTTVLPEHPVHLDRLAELASRVNKRAAIIAVGGIRSADDVRAVLAAGAEGVQVHTLFAELGPACLPLLRGD